MRIICHRCRTEYEFDDKRVSTQGTRVKCSGCTYIFTVYPPNVVMASAQAKEGDPRSEAPSPSPVQADSGAPHTPVSPVTPAAHPILLAQGERVYRVKDLATLQRWIIEKRVLATDRVAMDGETFDTVADRPELRPFLALLEQLRDARRDLAKERDKVTSLSLIASSVNEPPSHSTAEFNRARLTAELEREGTTVGGGSSAASAPIPSSVEEAPHEGVAAPSLSEVATVVAAAVEGGHPSVTDPTLKKLESAPSLKAPLEKAPSPTKADSRPPVSSPSEKPLPPTRPAVASSSPSIAHPPHRDRDDWARTTGYKGAPAGPIPVSAPLPPTRSGAGTWGAVALVVVILLLALWMNRSVQDSADAANTGAVTPGTTASARENPLPPETMETPSPSPEAKAPPPPPEAAPIPSPPPSPVAAAPASSPRPAAAGSSAGSGRTERAAPPPSSPPRASSNGASPWGESRPAAPPSSPVVGKDASSLITAGWAAADQQNYTEALSRFEAAVRASSGSAAAHYGLAYVHQQLGNKDRAVDEYNACIGLDNSSSRSEANECQSLRDSLMRNQN